MSQDHEAAEKLALLLIQQVNQSLALLEKMEWCMSVPGVPGYAHGVCPVCGAVDDTNERDHYQDCELAKLLNRPCKPPSSD